MNAHAGITRAQWHAARRSVRGMNRARPFADGAAYYRDGDRIAAALAALPDRVQNAICGFGRAYPEILRFRDERAHLARLLAARNRTLAAGDIANADHYAAMVRMFWRATVHMHAIRAARAKATA